MIGRTFETRDFCMVRAPVFPVQLYNHIFGQPEQTSVRLSELSSNPSFVQILALASPDLSLAVRSFLERSGKGCSSKRTEGLYAAVARYVIRSTTRSTPFGAFAAVGIADFHESCELLLESHHSWVTIDNELLVSFIRELENDPALRPALMVAWNTCSYLRGDRAYLSCADVYGQGRLGRTVSVRLTDPVRFLSSTAGRPCRYNDLLRKLEDRYPSVGRNKLEEFLNTLLEQQFLLTNLQPSLTQRDRAKSVLDRLPSDYDSEVRRQLLSLLTISGKHECTAAPDIQESCNAPIFEPIGAGWPFTIKTSSRALESHYAVRVDTALNLKLAKLPHDIVSELAGAVLAMIHFSRAPLVSPAMHAYAQEFKSRYGPWREVPLLELLDGEVGLGSPATYRNPPPTRRWQTEDAPEHTKQDALLFELVGKCLLDGSKEISLTADLLQRFTIEAHLLPPAIDVFAQVAARSDQEINCGHYLLKLHGAAPAFPSGRALARFAYLQPRWEAHLQASADQEIRKNPEILFAELIYNHPNAHAGNVMVQPSLYRYQISVGHVPEGFSEQIPLSDLLVGLRDDCFYLRSKRLRKRVVARVCHLLTPLLAPSPVRFIQEISESGFYRPSSWDWGPLIHLPFLPRVKIGKVILAPARWRLSKNSAVPEEIALWRLTYRVPRYIYMVEGDNRLLLDLDHALHVKILCHYGRRHDLTIEEAIPQLTEAPLVDGRGNNYMLEIVVPLTRRDCRPLPTIPIRSTSEICSKDRLVLPGENVLYWKLYGPPSLQNDLLFELTAELEMLRCVTWFYVRYADPDPHLRLRLFGDPKFLYTDALPRLSDFFRKAEERCLITRVAIETYEPEMERYGGIAGMAVAERLFAVESRLIPRLLQLDRMSAPLETMQLPLLSLNSLLDGFAIDYEIRRIICEGAIPPETLNDRNFRVSCYAEARAARVTLAGGWQSKDSAANQRRCELLALLRHSTSEIGSSFRRLETQGVLLCSFTEMIPSLLHMHCNRIGIEGDEECRVMYCQAKAYDSLARRQSTPR